jgi:hypothetical protein
MKNLIKLLILVTTLLQITGCKWFETASIPYNAFTNFKVPDGTPIFQQGYRDGCQNGLYSRGNTFYRSRYHGFNYSTDLMDNPEYKMGYGRGYGFCFTYISGTSTAPSGSADAYIYGAGTQFDMGRGDYNNSLRYADSTWGDAFNVGGYGGINGVWGEMQAPKGFSAFGSHPLYGTPSSGQIFGW